MFRDLVAGLKPCAIAETGTYRGTTTEFMAQTGLPIYTVEANPANYGFVRARFWRTYNITPVCGDSRPALGELLDGPLRDITRHHTLFFYLDAHWNEDLPLAEEIDIAFSRCPFALVMIDDFQVPFDPGYGYDDYGAGKALVPSYIASAITTWKPFSFDGVGLGRRLPPRCVVLTKQVISRCWLRPRFLDARRQKNSCCLS